MLPDALERANEEVKRQRRLVIYSVIAIVLVSVLVLLAARLFSPSASVPAQAPAIAQEAGPTEDNSAVRDEFKQTLKYFESEIEKQLDVANLSAWNPKAYDEIYLLKDRAVSAFSRGDYVTALAALKDSQSLVEKTLIDWQEKYATAFAKAQGAFNNNDPDRAILRIDEALIFKPTSAEALALKQRIGVLPAIQKMLAAVDIARVENNTARELEILKGLVATDPARVDLNERIAYLEKELAETSFASLIDEGLRAVKRHDTAKARAALAGARALFPARRETRILADKISIHVRENSLSTSIRRGNAAIARDDWPAALTIFSKALATNPDNKVLVSKVKDAKKITTLAEAISDFINRHHRLASQNVALAAEKTRQEASAVSHRSKQLAGMVRKLEGLLSQYNSSVEIVVRSDNKTHISIRGVGNIGLTDRKLIKLRPGKYRFEGKRPGFRSKLLDVVINVDQKSVEIELVSDEPI